MKAEMSSYLKQVKPYLKELLNKLLEVYPYASILGTDVAGKSYRVNKTSTVISDNMFTERGFVARVFNGVGYSEYSFNQLNKENVEEVFEAIQEGAIASGHLIDLINLPKYLVIEEEPVTFSKSVEIERHPKALGDEAIIEKMSSLKDKGCNLDERIIDCSIVYEYLHSSKVFLSKAKDLEQSILWSSVGVIAMASDGEKMKYRYRGSSDTKGAEVLEQIEDEVKAAVKESIELLGSIAIIPGEYDVICTPDVTGLIAHEAFGHGVEMDMFVKDRALARDYVGEYVASPLVTMHDGASAKYNTGTYFFDDEGNIAQDTIVIDKGILKQGLNDQLTAMALQTTSTGNGRRESFKRKAYARMTNTYFESGASTVEAMIASIQNGFLLEAAGSGMEDPKNWGIQCMVELAREIKDGKLTGKVYSPVILTGYVPDLLKSISMVSKDSELIGTGACGKGHKEWAKVSMGGPYIKARVRLG